MVLPVLLQICLVLGLQTELVAFLSQTEQCFRSLCYVHGLMNTGDCYTREGHEPRPMYLKICLEDFFYKNK